MPDAISYSQRLGVIGDAQFAAVAERWGLGRFIRAAPVTSGLFGQNVFLTTTAGDFVLRGAPHWVRREGESAWRRDDRWQFTKEVWFARRLHEQTTAPVPWPMLHDETDTIFGWPYIVMPRMPGTSFEDRTILTALPPQDRAEIASALGIMLAEIQRLTGPFAGDFDVDSIALAPYPDGERRRIAAAITALAAEARANGALSREDSGWLDTMLGDAGDPPGGPVCVHADYKLNNLTVAPDGGRWRVSGVFDLHEMHFGDGAADLVRQACSYLDTDQPLARVFVDAYVHAAGADATRARRLPLHILHDRLKIWQHFTQPGSRADWTEGKTFRGWGERYLDGVLKLL